MHRNVLFIGKLDKVVLGIVCTWHDSSQLRLSSIDFSSGTRKQNSNGMLLRMQINTSTEGNKRGILLCITALGNVVNLSSVSRQHQGISGHISIHHPSYIMVLLIKWHRYSIVYNTDDGNLCRYGWQDTEWRIPRQIEVITMRIPLGASCLHWWCAMVS